MRGTPNHSDSICRALLDAAEIAVARCNRFSRHPFRDWRLYGKANAWKVIGQVGRKV